MSSGPSQATIGVVIVTWNVRRLLDACLGSVLASPLVGHVVLVDNASTDGSVDHVQSCYPAVTVIANRRNVGYSRAANQGLATLGVLPPAEPQGRPASDGGAGQGPPPAILLLNPDAQLMPGALPALWARLESDERIGCVGPRLVYPDGRHQPSMRRFPGLAAALMESTPLEWHWPGNPAARHYRMVDADASLPQSVDWVTGAVMLLRSEALERVAGLDESFFLYSEELDLCRRLQAAGYTVRYEPAAVAIHHEAASSDQVRDARHLWFQESRVRYYAKHHGRRRAVVLSLMLRAIFAAETLLEASKLLLRHKPALRRARIGAYWDVVRQLGAIGDGSSRTRPEV